MSVWWGVGFVTFEVGLDGPAPAGGAAVNIVQVDSEEQQLLAVLVAEGEVTGAQSFYFPPLNMPGDHTIEAQLGESMIAAVVHLTW